MDSPEPGVEPGEGGRQAQGGVVVAGGLVGAHRDAAPVLEPVEAAFDDVAALVAVALVVVPDDGSAGPATSVGDLVVAFGDRRGDATSSKPGPVRLGRVSLVGDDPVRACAGPAGPGDPDAGQGGDHHGRVVDVAAGQDHGQRSALAVGGQVNLAGQTTTGPPDRMIRGFGPRILVIRVRPLCPAAGSRRADAPGRSSSRSRPPSPARHARRPSTGPSPAQPTTPRSSPTGRTPCRSCSTCRTAPADHATAPPSGTATRSPPPPPGHPPADGPWPSAPGTTDRSTTTPHQRSHHATTPRQSARPTPAHPLSTRPSSDLAGAVFGALLATASRARRPDGLPRCGRQQPRRPPGLSRHSPRTIEGRPGACRPCRGAVSPASPTGPTSRPGTAPPPSTPPPETTPATDSHAPGTGRSTGSCTSWPPSSCATPGSAATTTTARRPPARPPWKPCAA